MKRLFAMLLALSLLLCGTAIAEESEAAGTVIHCDIEDGSYVIRIADENGDLGWLADDMSQDDTVVRLASAELVGDEFVVIYEPVGDGEICVAVKHFTGIACDQVQTWDLTVQDGAVVECTGGSYSASPEAADMDALLVGEWLEAETQFTQMTIEANEERGWDVEIVSPMTHGAYVFKTTIYYDCDRNGFVYDKGKFWDLPITDSDEEVELGEAKIAGSTGIFSFSGDDQNLFLSWIDDSDPEQEVVFCPAEADTAIEPELEDDFAAIDYGASEVYSEVEMDEAIALIGAEFGSWEGCELHDIRYAGDEFITEENLAYVNSLREDRDYVDCIVFLTDFHSPVEGGGAWEADAEYRDFQWWLAREADGDWELLTWGY